MYEDREGEFGFTIQRHHFSTGKASWLWHVRHLPSGCLVDTGSSLRSHDHAKTAALDAIWDAELKTSSALSLTQGLGFVLDADENPRRADGDKQVPTTATVQD
jgi:hypothetical protein